MVPRAHLPSKLILLAAICFVVAASSCEINKKKPETVASIKDYSIDTALIPRDTVYASDKNLSLVNGLYWYGNNTYSGVVVELYPNGKIKKQISVYKGMLHGTYRSFFENSKPWEIRAYKNNLCTGKCITYWEESGKPKFEYHYYEEKMEGLQRKWYVSGKPYSSLNYANDHEDGLQQGWRENGKLFLNYEVKDGFRYGLQKAVLCYSLRDEKINSTAP